MTNSKNQYCLLITAESSIIHPFRPSFYLNSTFLAANQTPPINVYKNPSLYRTFYVLWFRRRTHIFFIKSDFMTGWIQYMTRFLITVGSLSNSSPATFIHAHNRNKLKITNENVQIQCSLWGKSFRISDTESWVLIFCKTINLNPNISKFSPFRNFPTQLPVHSTSTPPFNLQSGSLCA